MRTFRRAGARKSIKISRVRGLAAWVLVLTALLGSRAPATTTVIPPGVEASEGNGFFTLGGPLTVQTLFPQSSLNGLPSGAVITGLQFRVNNGGQGGNYATSHLDLSLGPAAASTLVPSVAANKGPGTVQVRSGPYSFSAGDYPGGVRPNAFGPVIPFSTPFVYSGGTLLLTLSVDTSTVIDFDAVIGTPGIDYGQTAAYNATTLTSGSGGYSPVIQLVYSVPEPGTLGAALLSVLCRRKRRITPAAA